MEVRQAEEEIFETPDLLDEGEAGGGSTAAALRLSRGLFQERETDPESLVPTSIDADSAFEVFHGKVFDAQRVDLSGSIARAGVLGAATREGALLPPREKSVETPIDRYLRLKTETTQLSDDLAALSAADNEGAELAGSTVWHHLAGQVSGLKEELAVLAGDPSLSSESVAAGKLPQASASLTEDLLRRVEELRKGGGTGPDSAGTGGKGDNRTGNQQQQQQVVYELYYDPARAAARASKLQSVEARIAALEKLVARGDENELGGGLSAAAGIVLTSKTQTLSEAIVKLEKQVALLDSTSSETIRQRLVLLKNEWDDFKRERSKHGNALDAHASAHHRRVESLYESLKVRKDTETELSRTLLREKLEPVAGDLPTLVSRLQVLQDLHAQSLDFSQRLKQLGTGQDVLQDLLKSTTENVNEVRKSLAENVKQLADNIAAVDARIEKLEKGRK